MLKYEEATMEIIPLGEDVVRTSGKVDVGDTGGGFGGDQGEGWPVGN